MSVALRQEVTSAAENRNMLGDQPDGQAATSVPQPTPICHITHVTNLPLILGDGGLRACSTLRQRRVGYTNAGTAMIELVQGNLLEATSEALVNTVNCVGVMGKGIALQF